jgi:hypothetical protein
MIGPKGDALRETCGYYGEKIVLYAQTIGLNTCWVGFRVGYVPDVYELARDEELALVIAIGYGANQGNPHKSKPVEKLCGVPRSEMPVWFRNGVVGAMMAPTAMNQQKFFITLEDNEAVITAGRGFMAAIDLGIVQCNFEAASGHACRIQMK